MLTAVLTSSVNGTATDGPKIEKFCGRHFRMVPFSTDWLTAPEKVNLRSRIFAPPLPLSLVVWFNFAAAAAISAVLVLVRVVTLRARKRLP